MARQLEAVEDPGQRAAFVDQTHAHSGAVETVWSNLAIDAERLLDVSDRGIMVSDSPS